MSNGDAVAARGRPHLPTWARFAGIVALYALPGPLIGAIGVNGLFTLHAVGVALANGDVGDVARLFWGGLVIGTIISALIAYAFGIVSATGVGLIVAIRDRRRGGISWKAALFAALAFWLLTSLAALSVVPPDGLLQWVGALLAGHVLAAIFCTWAARRLFR